MASGVQVDDEIASFFEEFKIKNTHRYFICHIENKKLIKIEKKGERSATYEDFCNDLPENEARYGVVDLEYKTKDGRPTSKIIFLAWNPDTGKIMNKMLYSSSKEAFKVKLNGCGTHINATDMSELDLEESILPVVQKFGN